MYVILFPNSNTNPSKVFRVANYRDWCKATSECKYESEHKTYKEALADRDRRNGK